MYCLPCYRRYSGCIYIVHRIVDLVSNKRYNNMKAVCIKAGAHCQWEVGRVYNVFGYAGGEVFRVEGAMGVSKKNFPYYFKWVDE